MFLCINYEFLLKKELKKGFLKVEIHIGGGSSLLLRLRTIVATMMLNFCVRYGYRCLHHAFTTASSLSLTLKTEQHSLTLTSFRSSPRSISTSPLNMSPCLHSWPIYLIVFKESYFFRMGSLILEGASRLDAFSVYPVRT